MVRRTHGRGRLRDEGSTVVAVCTLRTNFCWNSDRYAGLYSDLHEMLAYIRSLFSIA